MSPVSLLKDVLPPFAPFGVDTCCCSEVRYDCLTGLWWSIDALLVLRKMGLPEADDAVGTVKRPNYEVALPGVA